MVTTLPKLDDLPWTAKLGGNLSFSRRRALAAGYVMILLKSNHLVPLGQYCASDIDQSPGNYSFPTIESICKALKCIDPSKANLGIALIWTFYLESIYYEEQGNELLPAPQFVLQVRERAGEEVMAGKLHEIFKSESLEAKIATALAQNTDVPTYGSERREGREALDPKNCLTYVADVYGYRRNANLLYSQLLEQFHPSKAERRAKEIDLSASPSAWQQSLPELL
jgi:hypothetical protein